MRALLSTQLTTVSASMTVHEGRKGEIDNETDHDHNMYGLDAPT